MATSSCCCRDPECDIDGKSLTAPGQNTALSDVSSQARNLTGARSPLDPVRLSQSEASLFLQLPAEIRVVIYELYFHDDGAKALICRWSSASRLSNTSNLRGQPQLLFESHNGLRIAMLATNRLLRVEATPVFYATRAFRFNSEQISTLCRKADILDSFAHIEIEDTVS